MQLNIAIGEPRPESGYGYNAAFNSVNQSASRAGPGSELVRVHATDADEGPSGHVTYAFTDHVQRVYGELFAVDAHSGAVYLRTALDYETSTTHYLTVTATDLGSPPSLPVSAKVPCANLTTDQP